MSDRTEQQLEEPAAHWRRLAHKAFTEAKLSSDCDVQEVLKAIAVEYMALAEQAEAAQQFAKVS